VLWVQPTSAGAYAEALVATAAFVSGLRLPLPLGATGAGRAMPIKIKVGICQPIEREVRDYEDLNAWIEPIQVVQIRARVSGYLDGKSILCG